MWAGVQQLRAAWQSVLTCLNQYIRNVLKLGVSHLTVTTRHWSLDASGERLPAILLACFRSFHGHGSGQALLVQPRRRAAPRRCGYAYRWRGSPEASMNLVISEFSRICTLLFSSPGVLRSYTSTPASETFATFIAESNCQRRGSTRLEPESYGLEQG